MVWKSNPTKVGIMISANKIRIFLIPENSSLKVPMTTPMVLAKNRKKNNKNQLGKKALLLYKSTRKISNRKLLINGRSNSF